MMVYKFSKDGLIGVLGLIDVDHCTSKNGRIKWTTKKVLTLLDDNGRILSSAQFRSNARKQAEDYFLSEGWEKLEI